MFVRLSNTTQSYVLYFRQFLSAIFPKKKWPSKQEQMMEERPFLILTVENGRKKQLVPKPRKMAIIIPRRWRGTWEGVPMATWCSGWICSMGGGQGPHMLIIPAAFSLLPMRGAAVGRAPTILQNEWFYTRSSNFVQSLILSITSCDICDFAFYVTFEIVPKKLQKIRTVRQKEGSAFNFFWFAFITANSSLEILLEGLFAQIHVNLSSRVFGWNRTGDLRITRFLKCRALHHWAKLTDESPKIL